MLPSLTLNGAAINNNSLTTHCLAFWSDETKRVLVKQYGILYKHFTLATAVDSLHFFDQQQLQHHPRRRLMISLHRTLKLLASTYLKDTFSWQALRNSTQCRNHHSVWIWSTLNTYCPNIYQTISGSSGNRTSTCDQLLPKKRIGLQGVLPSL